MRSTTAFLLLMISLTFAACGRSLSGGQSNEDSSAASAPATYDNNAPDTQNSLAKSSAQMQTVSLSDADKSQTATAAVDRKIIRNADLILEVSDQHSTQIWQKPILP